MMDPSEDDLIKAAALARGNALCQYSGFAVGAAVQDAQGQIWGGCNVENSSFGLTVCAERVAIWKALSEGARKFQAIAIVTAADEPTPPCGACRQILWQFAGDLTIVSITTGGQRRRYRLSEIFPEPFEF